MHMTYPSEQTSPSWPFFTRLSGTSVLQKTYKPCGF